MKQSAAKTLGVAALGAAFAATGAGAANAAPAVPDAVPSLDTVTQALPAERLTDAVPGTSKALAAGQELAGTGVAAVQPVAEQASPVAPEAGLLGGLPVNQLPAQGMMVNGVPLGS
ncbi:MULTISPECIES: ATP-binding protein [unclassified Streptomyces]|uniref:ATP-binding protein n=1 Tax=unclassified Streptomyces TaxID=2593676 RepID=UPI000F6DF4ED|nr:MULTISPECIES: ATP-binding protein [unclassified Streptomyces]AZM60383.1 ATP-binding protein [Streptomyces sp. WAC 01438]RSM92734.1 ATP-binding protein [Streptomyces sp. WAC 01420]